MTFKVTVGSHVQLICADNKQQAMAAVKRLIGSTPFTIENAN